MNKTILAAAILAMAAFAGVMIVGDDTDAADAEQFFVTYTVDGKTIVTLPADADGKITLLSDAGLKGEPYNVSKTGYALDGWNYFDGTATIKYAAGNDLVLTKSVTLEAAWKLDSANYVAINFIADDKAVVDEQVIAKTTAESGKISITVPDSPSKTGYKFLGWYLSSDLTQTPVDGFKDQAGKEVKVDVASATYVAKFVAIYDITFVVEGTTISTISTGDGAITQIPSAPSKAHYNFLGWGIDGKVVITYNAGLTEKGDDDGYRIDGKNIVESKYFDDVQANIQFVAVFEPVQLTVTFQVGEFITTQTVLYGDKAMEPRLPQGYIAWMLGEKEFDFSTPITENITIVALEGEPTTTHYITFISEGDRIGGPYDSSKTFTIPDNPIVEGKKFVGWFVGNYRVTDIAAYVADHSAEDIEFVASFTEADPVVPEQPKFYQTPLGQCAIILAVFVVGLVFYGIFTGRIAVPKFKISRVEKIEEPVEQVEEEKKP